MKTTVNLPDDLFIAAKKRAAELRQPLRAHLLIYTLGFVMLPGLVIRGPLKT